MLKISVFIVALLAAGPLSAADRIEILSHGGPRIGDSQGEYRFVTEKGEVATRSGVADECEITYSGDLGYVRFHNMHAKCAATLVKTILGKNNFLGPILNVKVVRPWSVRFIFYPDELDGYYKLEINLKDGSQLGGQVNMRCGEPQKINDNSNKVSCAISDVPVNLLGSVPFMVIGGHFTDINHFYADPLITLE